MRARSVFTATTISPSPPLRQRPYCYTIRARRNLPDKEFRYLRTVIVTAAIHQGFGLMPRPLRAVTPLLNRLALGRCQSVYRACTASHRPVFLLNSHMGLFTVISPRSIHEGLHRARHPFSRSYGAILPSSLTRGHSSALVYSTCLPVSDCGTVTDGTSAVNFLGSRA